MFSLVEDNVPRGCFCVNEHLHERTQSSTQSGGKIEIDVSLWCRIFPRVRVFNDAT